MRIPVRRRYIILLWSLAVSALLGTTFPLSAGAQTCGAALLAPVSETRAGALTASNALAVLRAAVGLRGCLLCVCDVNSSASITTTDALTVLRDAVGLDVTLACPACTGLPDPAGLAAASCAFTERCEPALFDYNNESVDDCVARVEASLDATFAALNDAVAAGDIEFVPEVYDACEAEYATADCDLGVDLDCDYLRGLRTEGQGCSLGPQCASGLYCDAAPNACGVCRKRVEPGGDCTDSVCVPTAKCLLVSSDALCIPADLDEGAPCGTVETGLCRGHLQCVGENSTCQRPAGASQSCDDAQLSGPSCDIYDKFVCENETCVPATFSPPGGPCSGSSTCDVEGFCDLDDLCDAYPGAGEACNFGACAVGHYCNATNHCAPQEAQGASCTSNAACRANLYCTGAEPTRTCQPIAFVECP